MIATLVRHVLKIVPDAAGYRLVLSLTGTTHPLPLSEQEQKAMLNAKLVKYGAGEQNTAWEWGAGPLIVLVHGWGGRAAQMAPLATSLAAQGYRCVAPDITGHGVTKKSFTRWGFFLRDVEALTTTLQAEVFSFVGHSAGGMTMMALRKHGQIRASRYVCICAPSFPFPPVNRIKKLLNPRDGVIDRYKEYLGQEFGMSWQSLEAGESFADAGSDTLLIYEERDQFVPHSEGDRIHGLCPGSSLIKTRDFSHQRILGASEVSEAISRFLASDVQSSF